MVAVRGASCKIHINLGVKQLPPRPRDIPNSLGSFGAFLGV